MTTIFTDTSFHDVHRRQALPDWDQVVAAGFGTTMLARASYGDPQGFFPATTHFAALVNGAKLAGIKKAGGYHNLVRGNGLGIRRQVDTLRRELDAVGCTYGMCDVEAYPELVENGLVPTWSDVLRFHDLWYQAESRLCAWYIPQWVWVGYLGSPSLRDLHGPLIASYYPITGIADPVTLYTRAGGANGRGWDPYGRRRPDIWQYTAQGDVPGMSTRTDCNAFDGTDAGLLAVLHGDPPTKEDDMRPYLMIQAPNTKVYALFSTGTVRHIGPAEFSVLREEVQLVSADNAEEIARLEIARTDVDYPDGS